MSGGGEVREWKPKLRPLAAAPLAAHYPLTFPDETPAKLVRRGILSCSSITGDCTFVLLIPDTLNSVN